MNALADTELIQPGDMFMPHNEWNALTTLPDDLQPPDCWGSLRYGQRHARGRMIEVECTNPECHFGLSVMTDKAELLEDKKSRRVDRLADDAQRGEDSP